MVMVCKNVAGDDDDHNKNHELQFLQKLWRERLKHLSIFYNYSFFASSPVARIVQLIKWDRFPSKSRYKLFAFCSFRKSTLIFDCVDKNIAEQKFLKECTF